LSSMGVYFDKLCGIDIGDNTDASRRPKFLPRMDYKSQSCSLR
jgi:hypothetical protein